MFSLLQVLVFTKRQHCSFLALLTSRGKCLLYFETTTGYLLFLAVEKLRSDRDDNSFSGFLIFSNKCSTARMETSYRFKEKRMVVAGTPTNGIFKRFVNIRIPSPFKRWYICLGIFVSGRCTSIQICPSGCMWYLPRNVMKILKNTKTNINKSFKNNTVKFLSWSQSDILHLHSAKFNQI